MVEKQVKVEKRNVSLNLGPVIFVGVVVASFLFLLKGNLQQTSGHFTYALDDPYIHLALAKNLALHGVWGVTPYANTSCSSSPLWTLLIALSMKVTGKSIYAPFLFGLVFSTWSAVFLYRQFFRQGFGEIAAVTASLAVFLVAPLHVLPFLGMEACLQVLLVLVYAFWLVEISGRPSEKRDVVPTILLTFAMCLTRYECAFLIVVPFLAHLRKRDWRMAACLAAGPLLAIGGFALISHRLGMPPIPNSVLIKGNRPGGSTANYLYEIAMRARYSLYGTWMTISDLVLFAIVGAVVAQQKRFREGTAPYRLLLWTALVAAVLQSGIGHIGVMLRYEAYFIALLAVAEILLWRQILGRLSDDEGTSLTKEKFLLGLAALVAIQFALSTVLYVYKIWFYSLLLAAWLVALGLSKLRQEPQTTGRLARALVGGYVPAVFLLALIDRILFATVLLPNASRDIFTQQCQMSRFIHHYYKKGRIVANDIGAISYFNNVHLLDLEGLASDDVARLRLAKQLTTGNIAGLLQKFQPDVIVFYPEFFRDTHALPSFVVPVADWVIPPVTSAASPRVVFAAMNRAQAKVLQSQLMEFRPTLPGGVKVRYFRLPKS